MEMGVNFIRVHDLWGSADMDIVFPNFDSNPCDEAAYNFSSTDIHISAMLSTGAHVIFRLGYSYANPLETILQQIMRNGPRSVCR